MGFSRQEYWSRLPFPPPEDLSDQGWNPRLLCLMHYSQILNPLSHLGSQLYLQMQKHICKFSYLISFGKNIKTDFQGASESDFSQVWLTYHIFFLNFIIIFLIFNWTIVDLKCCVSYCCKAMWISYTYTYIHFFRFFSHIDHDRAPITCLIASDSSLRRIILAVKWKQFFTEIMIKSDFWSSFDAWEQTALLTQAHNTLKGFHAWDCPSIKIVIEHLVFRKYWYFKALSFEKLQIQILKV